MAIDTSISFEEALTAYRCTFLARRNLALRTRKEYLTDLRQLTEYLRGVGVMTVAAVERLHLEGFLATRDEHQLAGTTRRRKVAAIRSLFLFLEDARQRTGNPAAKLVPPEREWNEPVPDRAGVQAPP
jgi:integrase/recombinase XerD